MSDYIKTRDAAMAKRADEEAAEKRRKKEGEQPELFNANPHVQVRALMLDGKWRSIEEIHNLVTGIDPDAIPGLLTDLEKDSFGGWAVQSRPWKGVDRWRVVPAGTKEEK